MARTAPLACVFLLSGVCAVVFETLWFHQAALVLGDSVWAASLVLSAFMTGMAIGNWAAARSADRIRDSLRAYAALEVLVAAGGVLLVWVMPELASALAPLAHWIGPQPAVLNVLRFSIAFTLLLFPSAAMGMSLPLLTRAAGSWEPNFGRSLGLLYGANTLGAVLGGLITALWLMQRFGIRGSACCAAALNLVVALLAVALSRGYARRAQAPLPAAVSGKLPRLVRAALLTCAAGFLAGLLLLSLEVVWLRVLVLLLNDTPSAFAIVLALVLSGIAFGSLLASLAVARWPRAADAAWLAAYACGLFGLGGYLIYPKLLLGSFPAYQPVPTIAAIAAPLVVPTSFASGVLFTLLGARLRRFTDSNAEAAGLLGFANALGAGIGPIIAGFFLLPQLGMERALLCLLGMYGIAGFVLAHGNDAPARIRHACALLFVAALVCFPYGRIESWYIAACARRWVQGDAQLVDVHNSTNATLLHIVHRKYGEPVFDQIATNAYSMTVNSFVGRRYMKACVYLPVALHPGLKRALVVGFGIGNTAKALTDTPELERIDIVDISRDMLAASRKLRVPRGSSALDDPRVHVQIEDARFFLHETDRRYDLITGEPPPPIIAGVVNLYTTEYFALVRSRLAPGGFATYWLPLTNISAAAAKSLIRGFCDVFADCSLWHGAASNLMLMGTRDAQGPVSAARFGQAWNDRARSSELIALGFELPAQLSALFIGDADYLRGLVAAADPLTDDYPKRLYAFIDADELASLTAPWHDAHAAHARFQHSAWIASLWPPAYRGQVVGLFEIQTLIDDLLGPESSSLHDTRVLHQVLVRTGLRLPVLLLMDSGPDIQEALLRMSPEQRQRAEWRVQRAAGELADRDVSAAIELLSQAEDTELPIPDLRDYLDFSARHSAAPQLGP